MAPAQVSRTPARSLAKTTTSKFPLSKKKPQRNASILTYFKKAADEDLFVGGPQGYSEIEAGGAEDDIYGLDDTDADGHRYNEVDSPVKKRKLSPQAEEPLPAASTEPTNGYSSAVKTKKPFKKNPFNPFLEDSSDEEGSTMGHPTPRALPLRPTDEPNGAAVRGPKDSREDFQRQSGDSPRSSDTVSKSHSSLESKKNEPLRQTNVPPPLKHEATSNGDFGDFEEMDMDAFGDEEEEEEDFGGEEFRERRYMEEQARFEAEESGTYSFDDELALQVTDSSMTESCPICNGSLTGVTADEATAHVNSCLDGNPIPLPVAKPMPAKQEMEVDGPEIGKRFARAAVPRPAQANPIVLGDCSNSGKTAIANSAFAKLMSGHAEDAAWATAAAAETASRGKPAYQRTCPFYKIMPGLFICVDAFRYGAVEGCKAYFLSHFHSDHYVGLTANWTHGPIYCSKVTGSLVKTQLKTAAKYVVELEFEEKVPVPETDGVSVTMIPANHCPGSSLFLFEKALPGGRTQRILHCGDFRACPAHIAHPQLQPETVDAITGRTRQQKIDVCYLDTTYLNPRYSFPPQENVIRACAHLCVALNQSLTSGDDKEWDALLRRREGGAPPGLDGVSKFFTTDKKPSPPSSPPKAPTTTTTTPPNAFTAITPGTSSSSSRPPPRLLIVCGTYSIGKERICKAIAQALGTRIFASPAKARIMAQLGDAELTALLTPDPLAAQVHMLMLMEIRAETLAEYLAGYRGHFTRVVGFRPSGWNYRPSTSSGSGGAGSEKVAGAGAMGTGKAVGANLPPGSLPTVQLLHGPGWRTRFGKRDLVPQRGSGREAMCFGVPYSEHSSFRELAMFVMSLRIEKVVPTVNVGSEQSRKRMKGWIDRWMSERRKGGLVSVLEEKEEEGDEECGNDVPLWEGKDGKGGGAYW